MDNIENLLSLLKHDLLIEVENSITYLNYIIDDIKEFQGVKDIHEDLLILKNAYDNILRQLKNIIISINLHNQN